MGLNMNFELLSKLKKLEREAPYKKIRQNYSVAFVSKSGNVWESVIKGKKIIRSNSNDVIKAIEKAPIPDIFSPSIVFVEDVPEND